MQAIIDVSAYHAIQSQQTTVRFICFTHRENTLRRRVQNSRLNSMTMTKAYDENDNQAMAYKLVPLQQ